MVEDDPLFKIRNCVIVIAGAGGGLGGETARALHGRGARLILFDIDEARLRSVEADCSGAVVQVADITDEAQLRGVTAKAMEEFGRIDGAVNAAGLLPIEPSLDADAATFRKCIDVNLTGAFLFSQSVARTMQDSGGRIVHIASVSSFVANAEYAAYASSKAALAQLVRVLAREWASRNILVNTIGPALTETALTQEYLSDPGFRDNAVSAIPMGRLGTPEDLIGTVLLLLTPGGAFITGQTIYVDGGRTLV